ncbi:hypothetical protein FGG08_005568 [Glutinoglossum americanum]|uniref:Nephrocystin 3-like N-terminal domain-containing protein n=1 Tax=Glutinoglossum americanum TaxID=1670608 RepID=A0A9P8I700_9PEZI|nr:hypothetical protein FGG08_005568 [Glutinoglossum americanum]
MIRVGKLTYPRFYLVGLPQAFQNLLLELIPAAPVWGFPVPVPSAGDINLFAYTLLDSLNNNRKEVGDNRGKQKRIIFVGHGFGGIVVKQALIFANTNQKYQEIAATTSKLAPDISRWENLLLEMIPTTVRRSNTRLSRFLEKLSAHVEALSVDFYWIAKKYRIINLLDPNTDSWVDGFNLQSLGNNAEENISFKNMLTTSAIYDKDEDLMLLYQCLAPLDLIYGVNTFEDSGYIECLERLSCPWHSIIGVNLPVDLGPAKDELRDRLFSHLQSPKRNEENFHASIQLIGPPGCGKAILLRNLAYMAKVRTDKIIVTFFKDAFKTPNPSSLDLLATFLCQILSQKPSMFCRVESYYRFCCERGIWTERALWIFVRRLLRDAPEYELLIFVNDLTEWPLLCQPVFSLLAGIVTSLKHGCQIIFTSQEQQSNAISNPTLVNKLVGYETWNRIIKTKIADLSCTRTVPKSLGEKIDCQIQQFAPDFLTPTLYLQQISRLAVLSTPAAIEQGLRVLPYSEREIYRNCISHLANTTPEILEWSRHALSWVVHAFRPLSIQEISVAVAISQAGANPSLDSIRMNIPEKMWEDLDRHLGLFIRRYNQTVLLFHESTKDFLLSCGSSAGQNPQDTFKLLSHAELASFCLDYISAVTLDIPSTVDRSSMFGHPYDLAMTNIEYVFLQYAAEYWPEHYSQAGFTDELDKHTRIFLKDPNLRSKWYNIFWATTSKLTRPDPYGATELGIACELGLTGVVRQLIGGGGDFIKNQEELDRPLDLAVRNRHVDIIDHLLHAGARSKTALHFAARNDDVHTIKRLLSHDCGINAEDSSGATALHAAAECGCLEAVKTLIACDADRSKADGNGYSPLDRAVSAGHIEIVSLLLRQESCINGADFVRAASFGHTEVVKKLVDPNAVVNMLEEGDRTLALAAAVERGHTEIVCLLINAGADITSSAFQLAARNGDLDIVHTLIETLKSRGSPLDDSITGHSLHFASENGHLEVVRELFDAGVSLESHDQKRQTALHRAAGRSRTDIVKYLLECSADRYATDDDDLMPFHLAAKGGHVSTLEALQEATDYRPDDLSLYLAVEGGHLVMVKYLLRLKPKPTAAPQSDGKSPDSALRKAASKGYSAIVRELCKAGVNVNRRTGVISPLHEAASKGHYRAVSSLIENGADVNARGPTRQTPLHQSVAYPEVVQILLNKRSDPNAVDIDERRPLHLAVEEKCEKSVQILLDHGADVNVADENMNTPLHLAAEKGEVGIVQLLLDRNARADPLNSTRSSPLHLAVPAGHQNVIMALLTAGAEADGIDSSSATPLYLAAYHGRLQAVKVLHQKGASLGCTSFRTWSPLHAAADSADITSYLIQAGADKEARTKSGLTPLMLAAIWACGAVVEVLVKAGADVNQKDRGGGTVLDKAIQGGDGECIRLIREAGGKTRTDGKEEVA